MYFKILLFLTYSFFIAWIITIVDNKFRLRSKLLKLCGTYKIYKIALIIIFIALIVILRSWVIPIIVYHKFMQNPQPQHQHSSNF